MRNFNEENERIKRKYFRYLHGAKGLDIATVDRAADAILRFEESTGFKPFKLFHIDQAMGFKAKLAKAKNARTGKPLSKATIDGTLRANKAFFLWLADKPGYKKRICDSDHQYFTPLGKDARVAHATRYARFPTMA